jgi:hypothetical protein
MRRLGSIRRLDVPATSGADIERHIEAHHPPDIKASVEEVRAYAYKALLDPKGLIRCITQKAKSKLAQHVKGLVMTPSNVMENGCAR